MNTGDSRDNASQLSKPLERKEKGEMSRGTGMTMTQNGSEGTAHDKLCKVSIRIKELSDKSILILRKILESLEKGVTKDPNKSWLAA